MSSKVLQESSFLSLYGRGVQVVCFLFFFLCATPCQSPWVFSVAVKEEPSEGCSGKISQERSSMRPSSRLVITEVLPSRKMVSFVG